MISKILVPTDGSKTAEKAVEQAVELAKQLKATVRLLSVVERSFLVTQSVPAAASPTHMLESVEDYMRQAAEAYLKDVWRLCEEKGVGSELVIRKGHPVEEILKEAAESRSDLIVMGSHGKSLTESTIIGSVTYGVIQRESRIPVMVVRR